MKLLAAATALAAAANVAAGAVIRRSQCTTSSDPDCIAGFNDNKATLDFDEKPGTAEGEVGSLTDDNNLTFKDFRLAADPGVGARVVPHSPPNVARAKFGTATITSSGDIFKFKQLWFGCEQADNFIPTPCTVNVTGYNPIGDTPEQVGTILLTYQFGQPGANGQSPMQQVTEDELLPLSHANYYVFETNSPTNSPFKPRVVLDDIQVVWYRQVQKKKQQGQAQAQGQGQGQGFAASSPPS